MLRLFDKFPLGKPFLAISISLSETIRRCTLRPQVTTTKMGETQEQTKTRISSYDVTKPVPFHHQLPSRLVDPFSRSH